MSRSVSIPRSRPSASKAGIDPMFRSRISRAAADTGSETSTVIGWRAITS